MHHIIGAIGLLLTFSGCYWVGYQAGDIQNIIDKAEGKIELGEERLIAIRPTHKFVFGVIKDRLININHAIWMLFIGMVLIFIGLLN